MEGAVPGKVVSTDNGVTIVGHLNVPGRVAASASMLYAKNLFAFLETMVDKATKSLSINRDDDLVKATMLTDSGKVVHPNFASAKAAPAETVPAKHVEPAAPKPVKKAVAGAAATDGPVGEKQAKPAVKKSTAKKSKGDA